METQQTYEQRYEQAWDAFINCGGEGTFRPPRRTLTELQERAETIEEAIAVEMLRRDAGNGGYRTALDYAEQVISDRAYAQPATMGMIEGMENAHDAREREISLAKIYLVDAIVSHRLSDLGSGSEQQINFGGDLVITTSLAAMIVEYHRRMMYAVLMQEAI